MVLCVSGDVKINETCCFTSAIQLYLREFYVLQWSLVFVGSLETVEKNLHAKTLTNKASVMSYFLTGRASANQLETNIDQARSTSGLEKSFQYYSPRWK